MTTDAFPARDAMGRPVLCLSQNGETPYAGTFAVEIPPHEARAIARQLEHFAAAHLPPRPAPPHLRLVVDNRYPISPAS